MTGASWKTVVDLIETLISKEPPFVQIVAILGMAFAFTMFVEGLRASFFPRRLVSPPSPPPPPQVPSTRTAEVAREVPTLAAPDASFRSVPGRGASSGKRNLSARPIKRHESAVNRGHALRPKIRRFAGAAPFAQAAELPSPGDIGTNTAAVAVPHTEMRAPRELATAEA